MSLSTSCHVGARSVCSCLRQMTCSAPQGPPVILHPLSPTDLTHSPRHACIFVFTCVFRRGSVHVETLLQVCVCKSTMSSTLLWVRVLRIGLFITLLLLMSNKSPVRRPELSQKLTKVLHIIIPPQCHLDWSASDQFQLELRKNGMHAELFKRHKKSLGGVPQTQQLVGNHNFDILHLYLAYGNRKVNCIFFFYLT